jgi:mRNA interferase MazF
MTQCDVYWYTFRAPDKRRPVLILTRNSATSFLTGITVAPITTTIRGILSEVVLTPAKDGVLTDCAVSADNIQTIQKANPGAYITHI